jgi:hypothetical protein
MKYVRVSAESVADKDDYPLSFDLLLDDKGKAAGDFYMYGLSGRPEDDGQCYPFALVADGSMDFGATYENEEDRWWKTDLRENKIGWAASGSEKERITTTVVKIDELGG